MNTWANALRGQIRIKAPFEDMDECKIPSARKMVYLPAGWIGPCEFFRTKKVNANPHIT